MQSMEIIHDTMDVSNITNIDALPKDAAFVDIETLGLSAAYHPIYMIGMAVICGEKADITLFFAEHPDEEAEVIAGFFQAISTSSTLVTYNGDMFDLPFVKKRAALKGIADGIDGKESIDLLRRVKKLRHLLGLPGCRQKDVEKFLGIDRKDEMDGGELIPVYKRYAMRPNDEDHGLLIMHNLCDVRGMISLLPVLAYEGLSSSTVSDVCVRIDEEEGHVYVEAALSVSIPQPLRCHADDAYLIFTDHRVKCAFRLHDGRIRYYFDNPKDYVFLIEENRVIPKKLAGGVAKNAKRRAKDEECFSLVDAGETERPSVEMYGKMLSHAIRNIQ